MPIGRFTSVEVATIGLRMDGSMMMVQGMWSFLVVFVGLTTGMAVLGPLYHLTCWESLVSR